MCLFSDPLKNNSANQITLKINSHAAYDYDPIEQASQLYVNDGLNRIKSIDGVALSYDGRGNLTQDAKGNQYQYNVKNLVTSATASGASVSLSYNASDRLLSVQKAGTSQTRFLYDNADLIAEYNTSGTLLRRYIHGPSQDEPLIWYEGAGTSSPRFLHADHQGSIIAVTNSSGSVLNINTYDEFGNKHSTNEAYASRFAYTGQVWLKELGLYYYKARMYDAKLGRFLQTDPIGYQDGMNWYGYTSGDPVNRRDPTGLSSTTCSNDPGVCQPPIEEVHVYGSMSGSSWSCEGWVCQDFLRDIFRTQEGAQERSDNQSWFSGNGVDDSDIRWSAGFQGGAKLGIKGLLGGAVELKAPVIETSLVTGNRYASEGYALVVDVGKWSFGYEAKRSIQVGNRDIMAGYLLRGIPYEGGFKFGSYGISSSEFGVFSIGVTAIGSIEATFDFVDGTK